MTKNKTRTLVVILLVAAVVFMCDNNACKKNGEIQKTEKDSIKTQTQVEDTIPPAPFESSEVA